MTVRQFTDTRDPYGCELILDLHGCNNLKFTRGKLGEFFTQLCLQIEMEKCDVHFWDDSGLPPEECQTDPKTKGTSAVCFILTSTIVVHTLDLLGAVYVNIFSCKSFDPQTAELFTREFFQAQDCRATFIERK